MIPFIGPEFVAAYFEPIPERPKVPVPQGILQRISTTIKTVLIAPWLILGRDEAANN